MVGKYTAAYGPLTASGHFTPPRRSAKGKVQGGKIGHSPTYGFTAQVAEVEVDTETGEVRLLATTFVLALKPKRNIMIRHTVLQENR